MLRTLELKNIRSYTNGLFEFKDGVNIVVGPNASGKTNLIESIYFSAQGKGFKSDDTNMISHDSDWGRIDSVYGDNERTVKLVRVPKNKTFMLDGVEKKRLSPNSVIPVILFEPSHMLLLGGEPERRRGYIDNLAGAIDLEYAKNLNDYKRALSQRNKLLKNETVPPEHMFVWDVRLSELAGKVVDCRLETVTKIQDLITEIYRSISGNKETLSVEYETKLDTNQYRSALLKKLKNDFDLDRIRGFTGSGPHRDDIRFEMDGQDTRDSASRGESRSVILALKIIELQLIEQHGGLRPIMLLDDVFSELDGKRRRLLAERLQSTQTFITTTDADAIVKSFLKGYNVITTS